MAALMTSNKKCEANRLCAQKSTGPKSERGKRHSSLNALRHGIFAESPVIPGEDLDEYAELADTFFAERAPHGVTETFLASEMVRDIWGVKRLNGAEKTFLEQIQKTVQGRNKRHHFSGDIEKMSVREAAAAYARTLRDDPFGYPSARLIVARFRDQMCGCRNARRFGKLLNPKQTRPRHLA